jgi:DNA-binding NtrC family response regulator
MRSRPILLMDEDTERRRSVADVLTQNGHAVVATGPVARLVDDVRRLQPSLVIVGACACDAPDRLSDLPAIHAHDRRLPIILLVRDSSESLAIAALRAGVKDYFTDSVPLDALAASASRWIERSAPRRASAPQDRKPEKRRQDLLGHSQVMRDLLVRLARIAASGSNVLITGETGTGKELAAQFIHDHSARRAGRFVAINCAAIPDTLLESELFGYERGAFTGAHTTKPGQLQLADGGTVFLDEVADLGPQGQAKILRAIESGQLSRLGSQQTHPVDLRVIAATNQDVERAVEEGRFRKDLYFRLNVARVHLPPLRERHGDLRTLLEHYIEMQNRRLSTNVEGVTDETVDALAAYDWPGNVRELKNAVESLFVNRDSGRASLQDFPDLLQRRLAEMAGRRPAERDRLLSALAETHWNVTRTAEKLRWSRMTIYRKIAKYNLPKPSH